jgi:hypothetical protein
LDLVEKDADAKCLHGRTFLEINLQYAKDFASAYKNRGFFGFLFLGEYSHDEDNHITWIDDGLYEFLNDLHENDMTSSTVVIVFSDHGPRFSHKRTSIKGLLEERNPFFSIHLPKLFEERYANEAQILKSNSDKLSTPIDVYWTLMHLIKLEASYHKHQIDIDHTSDERATSLFNLVSATRTCREAGIEQHWCACLKRTNLVVNHFINSIANYFVNYVNRKILNDHRDKCHQIRLLRVNKVYLLNSWISANRQKVKVQNSLFLKLLTPPKIEKDYHQLFFQLQTLPNHALYEFTIDLELDYTQDLTRTEKLYENLQLNEHSISRINAYSNHTNCIHITYPHLRKYCNCIQ